MKKSEFLNELSENLDKLNSSSKIDILFEYESHFIQGMNEGRSEEDISENLGNPKKIAKEMYAIEEIKNIKKPYSIKKLVKVSTIILTLSFSNLIILALTFFLMLLTLPIWLGVLIATPFFIISPILIIITGYMYGFDFITINDVISTFVLSIVGFIFLFIIYKIVKNIPVFIIKYLKWNLSLTK